MKWGGGGGKGGLGKGAVVENMLRHTGRQSILETRIVEWYKANPGSADKVADALNDKCLFTMAAEQGVGTEGGRKRRERKTKRGRLSLRLMEFFIHSFLHKQNTEMFNDKTGAELLLSYRRQLRALGKANFDVFCRRNKKRFIFGKSCILSNQPQLEFFRWAVSTGALAVAQDNIERILALRTRVRHDRLLEEKGHLAAPEIAADTALDCYDARGGNRRAPYAKGQQVRGQVAVVNLELDRKEETAVHGAQGRAGVQNHADVVEVAHQLGHELHDATQVPHKQRPPGIRRQHVPGL